MFGPSTAAEPPHPLGAPRRDRTSVLVFSAVLVALMTTIAVLSLLGQSDPALTLGRRVTGLVIVAATAVLFLILQWQIVRSRLRSWAKIAGALVIVLGVANMSISFTWTMLGISAATVILLLQGRRGSQLIGLGVWLAGTVQVWFLESSPVSTIGIPLVSLVVTFGLSTLNRLGLALRELQQSREEIARLLVDDERQRISRELHDIMGRALVSASLRQQAALYLLDQDTEKCRGQIEAAHETIASAQAQLRALTQGPVTSGLAFELNAARDTCERLGIRTSVVGENEQLPARDLDTLGARIVRESVTNMLKHSQPAVCTLTLSRDDGWRLSILNDGAPARVQTDGLGTGLAHLERDVQTLGGRFRSGPVGGHRYEVSAWFPGPATAETT